MALFKRMLGSVECKSHQLVRHNNMFVVYNIALSTNKPLSKEQVKLSLQQLMKIYPMLRMRIREDESGKYFQESLEQEIDFGQVSGSWYDQYHVLLQQDSVFAENRPVWRARFIDEDECLGKGVMEKVAPFKSCLLFGFHHSIMDGTSMMRLFDTLLRITDAALDNRPFPEMAQQGIFPPLEDMLLQSRHVWESTNFMESKSTDICMTPASWSKFFPVLNKERKTKLIQRASLGFKETKDFIQRCKQEGTTVNGALMAAINVAFFNHFVAKGYACNEELQLRVGLYVNMRRFFEKQHAAIFGFYVESADVPMYISIGNCESFWLYAKFVTERSHEEIKGDTFIRHKLSNEQPEDVEESIKKQRESPLCYCDYAISNIGDVSSDFAGVYDNVDVQWFQVSTSVQDMPYPLVFYAHSFLGKLFLSADCAMHIISDEDASSIFDDVLRILRVSIYRSERE